MGDIYGALVKVANDLGVIEKDVVNAGRQTYKAFGVDTVYRHLRPLFARHGVVVVPRIDTVEYGTITAASGSAGVSAHVTGEWMFYAADGSHVVMRFAAEGHDYQDKATNKAVQQAFKYGLIQMFQISTGEMDPDADVLPERVAPKAVKADPELARVKQAAYELAGRDRDAAKAMFQDALLVLGFPDDLIPTAAEADSIIEWFGTR